MEPRHSPDQCLPRAFLLRRTSSFDAIRSLALSGSLNPNTHTSIFSTCTDIYHIYIYIHMYTVYTYVYIYIYICVCVYIETQTLRGLARPKPKGVHEEVFETDRSGSSRG